jgi:hypothetical protein
MAVACLYTTVVSLADIEAPFGFVPPHGKRLAPGEQITVRGNLVDQIAKDARKSRGLERALAAGVFAIISTPAQHIVDATTGVVRQLHLAGGTLGVVDPCWGAYDSVP